MEPALPVLGGHVAVVLAVIALVLASISAIAIWKHTRRQLAKRKAFRALEKILAQRSMLAQYPILKP